jgi:hypothetical protein
MGLRRRLSLPENLTHSHPALKTSSVPLSDFTQDCVAQLCVIYCCAMKNPFEFGRELGVGELVDRDAEVAEVI